MTDIAYKDDAERIEHLVRMLQGAQQNAETYRKLAQDWNLRFQAKESVIHMAAARLGGTVEGHPTDTHNFLQRIDELRISENALLEIIIPVGSPPA